MLSITLRGVNKHINNSVQILIATVNKNNLRFLKIFERYFLTMFDFWVKINLSIRNKEAILMNLIPTVIETTNRGERAYDIYSRLLKDRIIMLGSQIDDNVANSIVSQLLFLQAQDAEKDIYLYINSPGGSVTAGFAIYDTIQHIKPDVQTICIGMAASMGSFLLAAGAKGKRFALPNAEVMIHQPLGGAQGQATEIEIAANHILKTRAKLNQILAERTGQSIEKIEKDTDRDNFLSAEEAKAYGLVDEVMIPES